MFERIKRFFMSFFGKSLVKIFEGNTRILVAGTSGDYWIYGKKVIFEDSDPNALNFIIYDGFGNITIIPCANHIMRQILTDKEMKKCLEYETKKSGVEFG